MNDSFKRTLQKAIVVFVAAAVAIGLSACYAPLGASGTGNLAVNVTVPGSIFTQSTQSYVARVLVVNQAYEQKLRRTIGIGMFVDENDNVNMSNPGVQKFFDDLEDEETEGVIDLILKATVKFGGKYFYDTLITADVASGGSFLLPGIPAGRSYLVYFELYEPGQQEDEDAPPIYESIVWDYDPEQWLFQDGDRPGSLGPPDTMPTLAEAQAALNLTLNGEGDNPSRRGYLNVPLRPGVLVAVEEGKTATADILLELPNGD